MYSVVLIDDEQWVMEDLKSLVSWNKLGFEIVGEANNAATAKEVIAQSRPDVVISDIRMPDLSGIQLLESYKNSDIRFKSLFVTAYGRFEYAQKALELGAFGYLLKPVEPAELESTLVRLKNALDMETGHAQKVSWFDKTIALYSVLDGYIGDDKFEEKLSYLGEIDKDKPYVSVIMHHENPIDLEGMQALKKWNVSAFHLSSNKMLLIIQNKKPLFNIATYKNLCRDLSEVAEKEHVFFGYSRVFESFRKLRTSFLQAQNAIDSRFLNNLPVNGYYDASEHVKDINAYITGFKMNHSVNELLNSLPQVLAKKKINIDNMTSVVSHLASQIGVDIDAIEFDTREIISQFENIQSYFSYLYQLVNESHKKGTGKTTSRYVIKEITDYIKYNYSQKLMINDLAQKFFLNPSYLSNLFKLETGKSFTSFLVECRLNKAIELLENTELSLYEISSRVGYDDYFHFSKLFKKYMNISPANYRKIKTNKEAE